MNIARSVLPAFLLLLLLTGRVTAQSPSGQAAYWLEKMSHAVHELNYDGHFVYIHNNNIESLRTVHSFEDGQESERLFSQNGEARELLRDDVSLTRIMPRSKNISTNPRMPDRSSFSAFFRLDPEQISRHYDVRFQGGDRVADRMVNVIAFTPVDNLRYGYRLFLDDEFAFPLQWEMFDHDQELVSRIMFTNISMSRPANPSRSVAAGDLPEAAESSQPVMHGKQRIRSTSTLNNGWNFGDLPEGYTVRHLSTRNHPQNNQEINQYLFSDGLSSFSVFIELSDKARLTGKAHLGALNAYGVYVDGYQLTAVGEVPLEALVFIANTKPHAAGQAQ
jgi:sigma-E factor negative regulatory protein RseB